MNKIKIINEIDLDEMISDYDDYCSFAKYYIVDGKVFEQELVRPGKTQVVEIGEVPPPAYLTLISLQTALRESHSQTNELVEDLEHSKIDNECLKAYIKELKIEITKLKAEPAMQEITQFGELQTALDEVDRLKKERLIDAATIERLRERTRELAKAVNETVKDRDRWKEKATGENLYRSLSAKYDSGPEAEIERLHQKIYSKNDTIELLNGRIVKQRKALRKFEERFVEYKKELDKIIKLKCHNTQVKVSLKEILNGVDFYVSQKNTSSFKETMLYHINLLPGEKE